MRTFVKQRHSTPDIACWICCFGGLGILVQKSFRGHDDATDAESALRRLFIDECLLNRVRLFGSPEPFERGDLGAGHRLNRGDARADSIPFDDYRASAALAESTTEFRAAKFEIVA